MYCSLNLIQKGEIIVILYQFDTMSLEIINKPVCNPNQYFSGDKIISVTVSFSNIVYEDALTILSYASPYDVKLELERKPSAPKRLGSSSFSDGGQKLFHPLYRSQSIDDLTQIDRELPRRSQSVGVAAHRMASKVEEREKMSLILSTTGSLNEKMLANVMAEGSGGHWKKKFEDSFESEDVPPTPMPLEREASKRYVIFLS